MKKTLVLFLVVLGLSVAGCAGSAGFIAQSTGHDVNSPYPGGFSIYIYNNTGTAMWLMYRGKEVKILGPGEGYGLAVGYYFNHTYTVVGKIRHGGTYCLAEKQIYVSDDYNKTPNKTFNQDDFMCPQIEKSKKGR